MAEQLIEVEYTHAHLFGGVGGGAMGLNAATVRLGRLQGRFRCVGSIDVDAAACRAFERNVGVAATPLDLFDEEQFLAWHGRPPPPGWQEAQPADLRRAFGNARPDLLLTSPPCKGYSGLLSESSSLTPKYQALNRLALRGIWLTLEAYPEGIPLIFIENVPRILTRGRHFLEQIAALFRAYGYAFAETTHDCGEIGGLAQSRKRFLGVARHLGHVPAFLYEPPKRRLLGVGEVIGRLPPPGDLERGGAMHRVPALQWQTWVRLAFVEAGKDWRCLNQLRVENGHLKDFAIAPEEPWRNGALGVTPWGGATGVVTSNGRPATGPFNVADPREELWGAGQGGVTGWSDHACTIRGARSPLQNRGAVADPRIDGHPRSVQLGVRPWSRPSPAIKTDVSVGTGPYAIADPRLAGPPRFNNVFRIVPIDAAAPTVAGPGGPGGGLGVADPRGDIGRHVNGKYRITPYGAAANAVIAGSSTGNGACAVADPRTGYGPDSHANKLRVVASAASAPTVTASDRVGSGALCVADTRPGCLNRPGRDGYQTQGHYGVLPWAGASKVVSGSACHDNGAWSVADPRPEAILPALDDRLVCVIIARDGTWHRPFTCLDLAALQGLVDPDDPLGFYLEGNSESAKREWVGNAIPPMAAQAIGEEALRTLLMAAHGETFRLNDTPIWVRNLAVALAVDTGLQASA